MISISWSRERRKLILRNYFPLTVFTKRFIVDVWISPGFWICQSFQYNGVLNIPGFWLFLVLNMSGFWIYHGSEYVRFTQGFEYTWLCLSVPKSVWMAFVLHLPIVIPYLKDRFLGKWKFDFFFLWVLRYLILFIVLV